MVEINLQSRKRFSDLENELVAIGKDGRKRLGSWDEHVHTAVFKMDSQQEPTV